MLIGGVPVGSVDDVKLTDDGQAEVDISVDRPLHRGDQRDHPRDLALRDREPLRLPAARAGQRAGARTTARPSPRSTRPARSTSTSSSTPSRSRSGRRSANIIQGSATVYAGKGPEANQTYKYLSPSLVATDRLLQELDRDEGTLTSFLVNGASVVSSLAERRNDLSALTQNANEALGAIASQNRSFDQALVALPGALRQANTTFHNLRPALDDLDLLVNAVQAGDQEPGALPPPALPGGRPRASPSSGT